MFILGEPALKHAQYRAKNKSFICSYCAVLVTSGFHLTASCSCPLCCKESCVTMIWRKHAFSCSLKSWIKGSDTRPLGPRSIVEMKASGKLCESQRGHAPYGEVLLHGRWSAIKAHCFCFVQASKGILVSLENRTVKRCSLPKGAGRQVFISAELKLYRESCRNMCIRTNKLLANCPGWVLLKGSTCGGCT